MEAKYSIGQTVYRAKNDEGNCVARIETISNNGGPQPSGRVFYKLIGRLPLFAEHELFATRAECQAECDKRNRERGVGA